MQQAITLELKEVRTEVINMSPAFSGDRLTVRNVVDQLYRDARKKKVPYGFINSLKREVRALGFDV